MGSSDFRRVSIRYAQYRALAFDRVRALALSLGVASWKLRFTEIDANALEAWHTQWIMPGLKRRSGWDWDSLAAKFGRRPSDFRLALWSGAELCGLAVGRLSKRRASGRRNTVSLRFMEGSPRQGHPLKSRVAVLVFAAAEEYGRAFGASRLRLMHPLPEVLALYTNLGFSVVHKRGTPLYCEKEIAYEKPLR